MRAHWGALAARLDWFRASALVVGCAAVVLAGTRDAARAETLARQRSEGLRPASISLRAAPPGAPSSPVVRLAVEAQDAIDEAVRAAIERGDLPGAVVLVGRRDGVVFRRAYGALAELPRPERATPEAVYDLASLTKPIATATSLALLADEGRLSFDDPVGRHLPELAGSEHASATLRQLLLHAAGLPAIIAVATFERGLAGALRAIARTPRLSEPGSQLHYSDLGFVLLGAVVERVSGTSLDAFARGRIFEPLKMESTSFRPSSSVRVAPTELRDGAWLRGRVHDPRAAALAGVAGHAGLFASTDDLGRFARMLLGKGELDGVRVLSERLVRELVSGVMIGDQRRALGWDVANGAHPGNLSPRAFGHGGFTGTSLWIDPELDSFVVVLSNRLHPDGKGAVQPTVERVQAIVAGAARSGRIAPRRESLVETGIDVLRANDFAPLRGLRIGLLTNSAARTRDGRTTAETLAHALGPDRVRLFSPEHGLEARLEGAVADGRDARSGLEVHSLYGDSLRPAPAALADLDAFVVDLPDVGARFYTYLSTMREALLAASQARIGFFVLDRPNPLGGETLEGPSIDPGRRSFVHHHPLPVRHGMTAGEVAHLLAAELGLAIAPRVISVRGWRRADHFPATGLAWVRPSPNLPSYDSALLYPGIALLEATNVSVGRGTDAPFQRVGAPWLRAARLLSALRELELEHVELSLDRFVPSRSSHAGRICHGIRIRVTDPARVRPVTLGLAIARELFRVHPDVFELKRVDALLAHQQSLEALAAGAAPSALERSFAPELERFRARRAPHLLY